MFDALDSLFCWILVTLFMFCCLAFGIFKNTFDVIMTVLSSPPLLTFVLLGSIGIVFAVQQYSKYQKIYFEKHSGRKI